MQKLILALLTLVTLLTLNFAQPAIAAPSVSPTTVETLNRPGPSRPGETRPVTRRCTIKLNSDSCSMTIKGTTVNVYVSNDLYPVTFHFGAEYGAVSMVFNGTYTSKLDGYTASNVLNNDGSVTAKVTW